MTWCWFATRDQRPLDALASAAVTSDAGDHPGFLVAWGREHDEPGGAARIDARIIDPDGPAAEVSLALAPAGVSLLFDDTAVSQAIRVVLSMPPADACSTLSLGDDRFVGAVTVVHGNDTSRLGFDPFAMLFPARVLRVDAGLFGWMPAPAGPVTQRYGAGNPWPWDRFTS
ncbi:hypothetical protein BH24ACT3_BH24ACT3_03930 [soil metagenome]